MVCCVSWRDARADVYRLGNYRYLAAGGSPGRLYKAVLYLAIPQVFLSPFCRCMVVRGLMRRFSTGAAVAVGVGCSPVAGKEINTNDNGRMILSQTVDQDNNP